MNIVFHLAATVRFNERLNVAVNINTNGTARLIQLSTLTQLVTMRICQRLRRKFTTQNYTWTMFHTFHYYIGIYNLVIIITPRICSLVTNDFCSSSFKTFTVIDVCESEDETLIDLLEERILKIYSNTYTFTKNLAKQILSNNSDHLWVAIVRPSILDVSLKKPCLGWIISLELQILL